MLRLGPTTFLLLFFAFACPLIAQNSTPPRFEKLGTLATGIAHASPVVFFGTAYRLESLTSDTPGNPMRQACLRLVNLETGVAGKPFAAGYQLGSAFATEEKLYVFCVAYPGAPEITAFWTTDAETWSGKSVFRLEGWEIYGTSVCFEKERYLMAFEIAEPESVAATPMTIRFAESKDLLSWHLIGASYIPSTKRNFLAPKLIFDDIYYYLLFNQRRTNGTQETWVARSTDLLNWAQARKNPVLAPEDKDRRLREGVPESPIPTKPVSAQNLMNVNFDLCSHRGRVIMYYAWGDPKGTVFLGEAVWRGYMRDWLVSFFKKSTE